MFANMKIVEAYQTSTAAVDPSHLKVEVAD